VQVPVGKDLTNHPYRVLRLWRKTEKKVWTKQVKRTQRIVQAVGSTQLLRTGIADSFEIKTWGRRGV